MQVIFKLTLIDWAILVCAAMAHIPLVIGLFKEREDKSQVFFTWFIYFLLDTITAFTSKEIDGSYAILCGFSIGSLIMSAILFYQRRMKWKWPEFVVTVLFIGCAAIWYYGGPYYAFAAEIYAQIIIGGYMIFHAYRHPNPKYNLTAYTIFFVTGVLTVLNAKNSSIEQIGYGLTESILSVIIMVILIREKLR